MTISLAFLLPLFIQSALYTDSLQTQHWIEGTLKEPILTPNGNPVYEVNPLLAGRPEIREPYFRFLQSGVEALPQMVGPPLRDILLGALTLAALGNVVRNNRIAKEEHLPQYWGISYRWRF